VPKTFFVSEWQTNRSSLRKGDQVAYYIGLPAKAFAGCAVLASDSLKLSDEERERVSHGKSFYRAEVGVRLDQIQIWDRPRPIENVLPQLAFIENKAAWFAYLQGGIRRIAEEDSFALLSQALNLSLRTYNRPKETSTVRRNLRLKLT
jgi:hypothetical protein